MRLKPSYVFVLVFAALVALYFIVRSLFGGPDPAAAEATKAAPPPALVQAPLVNEALHADAVLLRGRTEAARSVVVRAETSGVVAEAPTTEGAFVARGAVLCRLAVEARQAALDQARAARRSHQLQQQGTVELAKKGYRSKTQVLQDQANLDAAQAAVRQAEIALSQVNIRAPFAGVFDRRDAEIGAYLTVGQPCGSVIELDPLLIVGDLPEGEASKIKLDAPVEAKLLSGQVLSGKVRYVARDADPQTRTYRVEIAAPNPGSAVRSGLSAAVKINTGMAKAHLLPVSTLVLDSAGRQGVRYVQENRVVAFAPVTVLEETPQGVWVRGLSGPVRVITVGQSYVAEGQKVQVAAAR